MTITLPFPVMQIDFAAALRRIRGECFQDALFDTVRRLSIPEIDQELAAFVPAKAPVSDLPVLAKALCEAGVFLTTGIGKDGNDISLLDDLCLLTLGPQLRGGANVRKGAKGIQVVLNAISGIVERAVFRRENNRIGEAEKSHQKAKLAGYVEFWTIVNVDNVDLEMAKKESPTTNRFYRISDLMAMTGSEYQDFKDRIVSLVGISS